MKENTRILTLSTSLNGNVNANNFDVQSLMYAILKSKILFKERVLVTKIDQKSFISCIIIVKVSYEIDNYQKMYSLLFQFLYLTSK